MNHEFFAKYTDAETFSRIVNYESVAQMWRESVAKYPDSVAVVDNESYTYSELDRMVAEYRGVLSEAGVAPGMLVGIFCPNSIGFVKAFLAAATLGAPSVLLPAHLDEATVFGCAKGFGLKAVVYHSQTEEKLSVLRSNAPDVSTVSVSASSELRPDAVAVPGSAICTVLFTGGTTGKSKGSKLSNRAVMAGVRNGCYGIKEVFEQRYLLVLPLTHVFGLIRNLLTALYTGSALFICRNNKDMFRDVAVFKPTIMVMVPALAEMALNLSKQFGRNMLGADLKTVICGAAAVAPYLVREYKAMGIDLFPGYGLTESANLVSGNPESVRKPDSVGLIYPDMEYKIVDGELWLKGLNMQDGYVGGADNELAYSDGYFKTGDLVRIDDEGFLYITGRTKEIIVLSTGENVSPQEVEARFYALDCVRDCLLYDTNEDGAEMLVLEVLPRMDFFTANGISDVEGYIKDAVAKVNETLPSFEKINKVIVRDTDFVRTPAMKIARNLNGNVKK